MTKRAFITCVTGQDGSYLAEFLLEKGYEVHGMASGISSLDNHRFKHTCSDVHRPDTELFLHHGDLIDGQNITHLILDLEPDEIYNLDPQSHGKDSFKSPQYTVQATGIGALNVLEAARQLSQTKSTKVYQASSSEMFGKVQESPQNEKTGFHPQSPYACAKVFAFHQTVNYREAYDLFAVNGILFNHESPRRSEQFVTRKITRAATRIKLGLQDKLHLGNLDAKRDWGYAKDYVAGMWQMLQHEKPEDFVLATGEAHTIRDFLKYSFEYLQLDWTQHVETDPQFLRPTKVNCLIGDYTKAKQTLGWEPTVSCKELAELMVDHDLQLARNQATQLSASNK